MLSEEIFQLTSWLMGTIEGFPRAHKFTLGDRLVTTALDLAAHVNDAIYVPL